MNNLLKVFIFGFLAITTSCVNAQDNSTSLKEVSNDPKSVTKKLNMRIYSGPALDFLINGEDAAMKGGRFSMIAGFELNKALGKNSYGILGLGVTSGGYERWITNDRFVKSKSSFDQVTALELPLGIGFNLAKNAPKGFYTNLTVINSFTLRSESNISSVSFGNFEVSSNQINNTYDVYNLGARAEFGFKTKFEKNSYASFSLAPRLMLYNRFSSNTSQYTGMSLTALMGFYF